jgi:hypothetical protein
MAKSRAKKAAMVFRTREQQEAILHTGTTNDGWALVNKSTETYVLPTRPEQFENATLVFRGPNVSLCEIFRRIISPGIDHRNVVLN